MRVTIGKILWVVYVVFVVGTVIVILDTVTKDRTPTYLAKGEGYANTTIRQGAT
jgi:hypothetical protein